MKNIKIILTPVLLALSTMASAAGYTDVADVISSKAVYKNVQVQEPYQYCYETQVNQRGGRGNGSATNEILGGILGGVIGNQFGGGSGKKIATVAGTLLGASIANDLEKSNYRQGYKGQTKQVCETRYRLENAERFSHYLVRYSYKGVEGTYESNHEPRSKKINVRINISVDAQRGMYRDSGR